MKISRGDGTLVLGNARHKGRDSNKMNFIGLARVFTPMILFAMGSLGKLPGSGHEIQTV
jgi:hypothetical protein